MARLHLLASLALASLLVAGPASAVYVMTPLRITPTDSEAEVGDQLELEVSPDPESDRSMAGATLTLRYTWDPNEGQASGSPDEPSTDAAGRYADAGEITLDEASRGTIRWTVPAEVDDRNVGLSLVDAANESVAFAYVRVGDAEPQMRTMVGGPGGAPIEGGGQEPLPDPTLEPTPGPQDDAARESPGPAPLLVIALVALGAASARRAR